MKLIIDIPDHEYKYTCERTLSDRTLWDDAIRNGTPLDDVKETIEQDMSFDMFDDYGNKTRIHKELWEILDNIGKESEGAND